MVLTSVADQHVSDIEVQGLVNIAWAFVTVGAPAPLPDSISVLETMEALGTEPELVSYQMLMQALAATAQIVVGFALITRWKPAA